MEKSVFKKIFIIILILLIFYIFWEDIQNLKVKQLINSSQNPYTLPLIIIGLFILKSVFFFVPATLIFISTGMVLRTHLAVIICLTAVFCEMSLTYFYGYFLRGDLTQKLISKIDIQNSFKTNLNNKTLITFFLRLTPVAIEPVSFFMGAQHYNFKEYIMASIVGILPRMILFIMIGDAFKNSISIMKIIIFVIFIVIWSYGTFFLKKMYLE